MHSLSVFVSSTCYDLKALREHLRSEIASWGHDPVLSEFASFPVDPDLSTVENSKKVVRERADVLVLVVGGRRGFLDSATNKSVVNLEYREARAKGLDCFVFVDRQVWNLLPMYRRNKDSDFSHAVDDPAVFRFIEEIEADTKWIFSFQRTEEILEVLRVQLSARLRDLLLRSRENRLLIPPEFANEPAAISRIAADRDRLWEYRLACELLRERKRRLDAKFEDIDKGFVVRRVRRLNGAETLQELQNLMADFTNVLEAGQRILEDGLTPAFGPPGASGDAFAIKRACDNLFDLFMLLYDWELGVRFVVPHEILREVFQQLRGFTRQMRDEFQRLPDELDTLLAKPDLTGEFTILLKFEAPAGADGVTAEINRIRGDRSLLLALLG